MSTHEGPATPEPPLPLPLHEPTRELLLAQALDACIRAEQRAPGSAQTIIAHQPSWARSDLRELVDLARCLEALASKASMSDESRMSVRARLMTGIGGDPLTTLHHLRLGLLNGPSSGSSDKSPLDQHRRRLSVRRRSRWLWRGVAGVFAAVLGTTGILSASASSLPGQPLYGLKQAQEELGVRLAVDDQARAMALFRQADARLDETARLLQQGRTQAASETALRYDQLIERATSTYVLAIDDTPQDGLTSAHLETTLNQQQQQLQTLMQSAPEPARTDLREALVTAERGRALLADPRPVEQALGRQGASHSSSVVTAPTTAEDLATIAPTPSPTQVVGRPKTVPAVIVAGPPIDEAGSAALSQAAGVGRR